MLGLIVGVIYVVIHVGNAIFSSGDDYKSTSCSSYLKSYDDDPLGDALSTATDLMNSTNIDPKGGASDAADFADDTAALCRAESDDTKLGTLAGTLEAVFLQQHPRDAS